MVNDLVHTRTRYFMELKSVVERIYFYDYEIACKEHNDYILYRLKYIS